MVQAKEDRVIVKNTGGMTKIIHHGAEMKDQKPKVAERCEKMEGPRNLRF